MFKIESYVTPILLSYVDKYVRDFKPADAQVSIWAGGVALHNLVLKPDVLQKEVSLPFTLLSGRIHELLIHVPWTKIMSEPIVVTINTIECVLSFNPPTENEDTPSPPPKPQSVETPPGYMQALVRRIVSNISLQVHHLIVKYIQDDIVLSLNVKFLSIDSTGANWERSFADIDQTNPVIRRLVHLDDLTLCLDNSDSDGKIRFYQEPLLYRCQLDLRVLTSLVSANSRLAGGLSVQLRSTKLAWSVTNEQLYLLVRLVKERPSFEIPQTNVPKTQHVMSTSLLDTSDPIRTDSWAEWAWSWLPSWTTQSTDLDTPLPANVIPVTFSAFIDDISIMFKILDSEAGSRKRFRPTLELATSYAALKMFTRSPTIFRVSAGMRTFELKSIGKCVCGYVNINAARDEPTIYCTRLNDTEEDIFEWNADHLNDITVETISSMQSININIEPQMSSTETGEVNEAQTVKTDLFEHLDSVVFVDFTHERCPPNSEASLLDIPPKDFQDSDWIENCRTNIEIQPLQFRVCTGLYHRLMNVYDICKYIAPSTDTETPMRRLTVEDCEALLENLPQRRIQITLNGFRVRLYPWDHYSTEKTINALLCLDIETSDAELVITAPLYPLRVCSAACQTTEEDNNLWKGARLHISGNFRRLDAKISTSNNTKSKLCARADLQFVTHVLLNQHFFSSMETVRYSYSVKFKELNVSGSAARLQAAYQICVAMITSKPSPHFRHTSLFTDALEDEDLVALDMTLEELRLRGYMTILINTHIITLDSARATVIHSPEKGVTKQAWLFSAPDIPSSTSYLRAAFQWCVEPFPNSLDYLGVWTEPIAVCIDPLFISWLSYKPRVTRLSDSGLSVLNIKTVLSSHFLTKRRGAASSSSGRGGSRSGSATELVHVRTRSTESVSDRSEKKEKTPRKDTNKQTQPKSFFFDGENLLKIHERFRHVLITVELGLVLVYVTVTTAPAVDCPTVRLAMEKHVIAGQNVLCVSVGRWQMHSNTVTKHIWQDVKHNAPTVLTAPNVDESFPWKVQFADVSCYILETFPISDTQTREKTGGLKSQLKTTHTVTPRTILELVTTVVTLSVVMKARQYKSYFRKPDAKSKSTEPQVDEREKYFETGTDFKPSTLMEFVRGPAKNKKSQSPEPKTKAQSEPQVTQKITTGPVVCVGINVHADTPPIILRMDSDQVHLVASAVHCIQHIISLSKNTTLLAPKDPSVTGLSLDDVSSDSESEEEELKPIFEPHRKEVSVVTTFFWFQWVISRVTVVVVSDDIKLVLDIEDIITSTDIQEEYNQLKIKIGTASLKHFVRSDANEWIPGVFGGRIIEAREPANIADQTRFMNITITQAKLSCLPQSWKEQLNPKLFDINLAIDQMWEIYMELAPLEVLLDPKIVDHLVVIANDIVWKADCPLLQIQKEITKRKPIYYWPFCYVLAGGMRVVIPSQNDGVSDDTIMIMFGKVSLNPHPDNPMYRRQISGTFDCTQSVAGNFEGRQYETVIKSFTIRTVRFAQLVYHESSDHGMPNVTAENPALKWNKPLKLPTITSILHSIDISILVAPSFYIGTLLTCGPGVEINLLSDCSVQITLCQLKLIQNVAADFNRALNQLNKTVGVRNKCAYSTTNIHRVPTEDEDALESLSLSELDVKKPPSEVNPSVAGDSGVELSLSHKKTVSIARFEAEDTNEYFELYVTIGAVDISLGALHDNSLFMEDLNQANDTEPEETATETLKVINEVQPSTSKKTIVSRPRRSFTEEFRLPVKGIINLKNRRASLDEGTLKKALVKLMHFTLQQPNLYYWKKKAQQTIQASIFNIWVGLGSGPSETEWHQVIISTEVGNHDPITDIPPALLTMKVVLPGSGAASYYSSLSTPNRGTVQIDVERPIQVEMDLERLKHLQHISKLMSHFIKPTKKKVDDNLPVLYKIRNSMALNGVDSAVIRTCQIGVIGFDLSAGWDSSSIQLAWGSRPDRVLARVAINSLLAASGPAGEYRKCILQPVKMGVELDAIWETWRKVEGTSSNEPTLHIGVDFDRVELDLRPEDLATVIDMIDDLKALSVELEDSSTSALQSTRVETPTKPSFKIPSANDNIDTDHYYKDDLRSGAFKIVKGGQLPMAYQVVLTENTVSWKYPHPRAITRLIAFPLPGQNEELQCVLELYNKSTYRWEPHTYFNLPVNDPMEICMNTQPPDAVFATTWRFRTNQSSKSAHVFEFSMDKFLPRPDPLTFQTKPSTEDDLSSQGDSKIDVTAEELSGVLRVDSYFSPKKLPLLKICVQMSLLQLHLHNSLPRIDSKLSNLQGYYISKPQLLAHQVITLRMSQNSVYAELNSMAGLLYLAESNISGYILDCETSNLEQLFADITLQAGLSIPNRNYSKSSVRFHTSPVRVGLQLAHIRTMQSLIVDWKHALQGKPKDPETTDEPLTIDKVKNTREITLESVEELEGRVTLWLHNCCINTLRVSQERSDEMIVIESGTRLAYRWYNPGLPRKIRFALATSTSEWHWSNSVPFVCGTYRCNLEETSLNEPSSLYLHISVVQKGSTLGMHISGRLTIANLLRYQLYYKVRAKQKDKTTWTTVSGGEIDTECLGRSVICSANTDLVLKIKLANQEVGWSGDIPLKECPKENVPWLVKVPNQGDMPFISVWCRVIKARSDGCILAMFWPLYVLRSHLPLDTDVLIVTDMNPSNTNLETPSDNPPPLLQCAPGQGSSTHLVMPGTTSARHTLSFQYRNVECPVTRDTIPLHYGVTDSSVFDKRGPVNHIHDVVEEMRAWIRQSGREAKTNWPYSIVAKYWPEQWQPSLIQPRCDVRVRYQAVKAGGGCSLELHLSPLVLMCNSSPLSLTLRAHDAAPLCKLEPGTAIAPATTILTKQFFLSIEKERETYVSGPLEVSDDIPGRYGTPSPGKVTLDHPTHFAIQCSQKVAVFLMYYEIKEDISVLGVASTYTITNQLDINVLVAPVAVPTLQKNPEALNPRYFELLPPASNDSLSGMPICEFWLSERWRGSDASSLLMYFCFALPNDEESLVPLHIPVPIRVADGCNRKAMALLDVDNKSIPVVVTQQKSEGRCIITLAKDPCPQFVVENCTNHVIAMGESNTVDSDSETDLIGQMPIIDETPGVKWWSTVCPNGTIHYSLPSYNASFPATPVVKTANSSLTFSMIDNLLETRVPIWCPPISITEGEQLVQLDRGHVIKVRVHIYPHSTSIKLLIVNQSDLSASDIRRRLASPSSTGSSILSDKTGLKASSTKQEVTALTTLDRKQTEDKLVLKSKSALAALALKTQGKEVGLEIYSTASLATIKASSCVNKDTKEKEKDTIKIKETPEGSTKKTVTHAPNVELLSSSIDTESAVISELTIAAPNTIFSDTASRPQDTFLVGDHLSERIRCVVSSLSVELSTSADNPPLFALNLNRAVVLLLSQASKTKLIAAISDVQIDNLQYESGQYDFSVIASTGASPQESTSKPALWSLFAEQKAFCTNTADSNLVINTGFDKWEIAGHTHNELTELGIKIGSLALYIEDAYVKALIEMFRVILPQSKTTDLDIMMAEAYALQRPVRLKSLVIHPIDLTLTLHTAVRMYIALDQSPLHLSAFEMQDMMTTKERLVHALTVHYLSAAILGAGWVVGGLELLGAPGALAARVGGARGGVRGVASATAAALVRSLSAWAGSLARNLDLLAGDEEHARRAAAARRRPPDSLLAGVAAGLANFAINILGAVGGLAHHPLVGVAVGETESGTLALRRSLVGALTKPLSATADLVAYAGHGLLRQTGWDPTPQPWLSWHHREDTSSGWMHDSVRWQFKLPEINIINGFEVLLNDTQILLILTHKYMVLADPVSDHIKEMIDLKLCTLRPYRGSIIEVQVSQGPMNKSEPRDNNEEDEFRQANSAAMARVARYTGAETNIEAETEAEFRVVSLLPAPGLSHSLHATIAALITYNSPTHFSLL